MLGSEWKKSTRSGQSGQCVEARRVEDVVEVRNSKNPDAGITRFTLAEWAAFLAGAKDGEFDV